MPRAKLSYSTQVFAAAPLAEAVAWASVLGLDAVEVGKDHAAAIGASHDALADARRLADASGVRLASLHAWGMTEVLDDVCRTTAELGAGLIVVHCSHAMLTDDFANQVAILARCDAFCRDRGVVLTVENSSSQRLGPFVALFDAVPSLRLTLDVKHAYKPARFGCTHIDYMAALGDRVANFHMLGIDPARDDDLGDGIPAGNNPPGFSWQQLADDLADRRYAGLITAECSLHVQPADALRLYPELFPLADDEPGLAHALSRHNVEFFGRTFAAVLA
ncbi:MAG: hypothetical protein BIFFINMI_00169 [Phycisphaerae bacterium]|nr:hypothetical protein [Phycisphaerae bacterium]